MPSTPTTFVPPLAARLNTSSAGGNGPPPFVPPLAAKLTPPVRSVVRVAATNPDRLNLQQAAAYLGVSTPTMIKLARGIPHTHCGRIWRFDQTVLDELLRGRCHIGGAA